MAMVFVDTRSNLSYPIIATLEHQGIKYDQRFKNRSSFKAFYLKSGDRFVSLIDISLNRVVFEKEINDYFSVSRKGVNVNNKKK